MNFEVHSPTKDKLRPLVDSPDDETSVSSDKLSFYNKISLENDPMNLIIKYEDSLTNNFTSYFIGMWVGFVSTLLLLIWEYKTHDGIRMFFFGLLESFAFYAWFLGMEARKRLQVKLQQQFLTSLIIVILVNLFLVAIEVLSSLFSTTTESTGGIVNMKVILHLAQVVLALYVRFKGIKTIDILVQRELLLDKNVHVDSSGLAEL